MGIPECSVNLRCSVYFLTGRVGSAFAAELGTMAVSEQTDSLRVLGSDPVDYLIIPRAVACMIAGPILNLMCFCMGTPPLSFTLSTLVPPSCGGHCVIHISTLGVSTALHASRSWAVSSLPAGCYLRGLLLAVQALRAA